MDTPIPYYLDGNDMVARRFLEFFHAASGRWRPATGADATTGYAFLSASPGGPEIHADLKVPIAEEGTGDGWYFARFPAAALEAHLASYADQDVWECVVTTDGYREYLRARVRRNRVAGR